MIRCVREDEPISQNVLHYVDDGTATIEFRIAAIYLMPGTLCPRLALAPSAI